jgi:aryl-alcohol dehydrogenase-like predicted oxidoreductase
VEQLEEARRVARVVSVQNRYNLSDRKAEALLEHCEAAGIAFLPWAPLDAAEIALTDAESDALTALA